MDIYLLLNNKIPIIKWDNKMEGDLVFQIMIQIRWEDPFLVIQAIKEDNLNLVHLIKILHLIEIETIFHYKVHKVHHLEINDKIITEVFLMDNKVIEGKIMALWEIIEIIIIDPFLMVISNKINMVKVIDKDHFREVLNKIIKEVFLVIKIIYREIKIKIIRIIFLVMVNKIEDFLMVNTIIDNRINRIIFRIKIVFLVDRIMVKTIVFLIIKIIISILITITKIIIGMDFLIIKIINRKDFLIIRIVYLIIKTIKKIHSIIRIIKVSLIIKIDKTFLVNKILIIMDIKVKVFLWIIKDKEFKIKPYYITLIMVFKTNLILC